MKADPGHVAANAAAASARPCIKVELRWNGSSWTDETSVSGNSRQVGRVTGKTAMVPPGAGLLSLGRADLGTALLQLDNYDGRYSTRHSGSMAATYGLQGIDARVSLGYVHSGTAEYVRAFTGRVMDTGEAETAMTADLTLHDLGCIPQQQKVSTVMYSDQRVDEWIEVLATAAGVGDTDLERGLCTIPHVYDDADFALEEMRKAASAEGGCVFYDAEGALRFLAATHWCNASSVATITVEDWSEVEISTDADDVYNVIAVNYQPRAASWLQVVHTLKRTLIVPPSSSLDVTLKFDAPMVAYSSCVLAANNGAGVDMAGYVTFAPAEPTGAGRWELTFANAHDRFAAFVTRFDVLGTPLKGRSAETYTEDAHGSAVRRQRDVSTNFYVQTEQQARLLAAVLAQRMKVARPTFKATGLPGNPLLELGDVVTLTGATRTGVVSKQMIITGIDWRYGGDTGYRMDVTLTPLADLYAYASGYFKVGTSALGSGRLFY